MKNFCVTVLMAAVLVGCYKSTVQGDIPKVDQDEWNDMRQYVELPTGLRMSYVEMGNPTGPVMILQHGTTDNSRIWSLAAPYFCDAGYHLYITDLRGQGYSSQPDGFYTIVDYACDIKAFMDVKNIDKAIMVGQSLGSSTMQAFMMMFPQRCEKVVLVASGAVCESLSKTISFLYGKILDLPDDGHPSDEFIDNWYAMECEVPEDFMNYLKKESQQLPGRVWKNIFGGASCVDLMNMYNYFDTSIPTLIMWGKNDKMITKELYTSLKEQLPFAEYKEYDGVGHNIHVEIPERFADDVMIWLKK